MVGDKEATSNTVNVRTRDNVVHGERSIEDVVSKFTVLCKERTRDSEDAF